MTKSDEWSVTSDQRKDRKMRAVRFRTSVTMSRSLRCPTRHWLVTGHWPLGFTLIELLVVMAIVGLLVATSVPALTGYAKQVRLKTATREVIGLLSLARSLAISSRSVRSVLLDEDRHELVIEETLEQDEPRKVRLPEGVDVSLDGGAAGTGRVVFQPTGALSTPSATVSLVSGTKRQTIAVTSATGAITLRSDAD